MLSLLASLIRNRFLFSPDDPATGTVDPPDKSEAIVEKTPEEIAAEEKAISDKATADAEAAAIAAAAEAPKKIAEIDAKLDEQKKLLNSLIEKVSPKETENVWTIEKLEEAEAKCHAGEYDMKFLPKITTMKALLAARQIAKEYTEDATRENTWADVNAKWDKGHITAIEVFGDDAKDPESKLFKTAQAILHQDPGYRRFQEAKAKGVKLANIDPSLIDPNLQLKSFEIAAGRLGIARKDAAPNPSPGKGRSSALGGGTLPRNEEGQSLLDKLEKRAVDSGDPRDWINLDKERMKQQREARRG